MGIGPIIVNYYAKLYHSGFFRQIDSILELGDQAVLVQLQSIGNLLQFAPDKAEQARMRKELAHPEMSHLVPNAPNARWLYRFFGVNDYTCLDINGLNDAIVHDLNTPFLNQHRQYDLVTNHGTSEHVFDQYQCFRTLHKLCKPGGYLLHVLPYKHYYDHCLYLYLWNSYRQLAASNGYRVISLDFNPDGGYFSLYPLSQEQPEALLRHSRANKAALVVLLQKLSDQPFRQPGSMPSAPALPAAKLPATRILLANHSQLLPNLLQEIVLELDSKPLLVVSLKEETRPIPSYLFSQQLRHAFYRSGGYATQRSCHFQCVETSIAGLGEHLKPGMTELLVLPMEASPEQELPSWDRALSAAQRQVLDRYPEIRLDAPLLEKALSQDKLSSPDETYLLDIARGLMRSLAKARDFTDFYHSKAFECWRFLMDTSFGAQELYRQAPEIWLEALGRLQAFPDPLAHCLLALFGRMHSQAWQELPELLKDELAYYAPSAGLCELTPSVAAELRPAVIEALHQALPDLPTGASACDLGLPEWDAAQDWTGLSHRLKWSQVPESPAEAYRQLGFTAYASCPLDHFGYLLTQVGAAFSLVSNLGVSSRVFDQLTCFRQMHERCQVNGYMLHALPCQGHDRDRYFQYVWPFYESLAASNHYRICSIWLELPGLERSPIRLLPESVVEVLNSLEAHDIQLLVLMQKQRQADFVTPFQSSYTQWQAKP